MQSGGPARGRRVSERPYTLVYDGDCRFCAHSVDLVATWDRGETVEIVPFQRGGVHERFPWIPESAFGAAAAERLVRILPGGRPLGCLFALPFARPMADRVYRLVARNRTRLGCGTHCAVPRPKGRPTPEG